MASCPPAPFQVQHRDVANVEFKRARVGRPRKSREMSTLPKGAPVSHHNDETTPLLNTPLEEPATDVEDSNRHSRYRKNPDEIRFSSYTPIPNSFFNILTEIRPVKSHQLEHKDFDSLDYDISYNVPYKNQLRSYEAKTYLQMEVMRWVLVCNIGILTGLVAFGIDFGAKELLKVKYNQFERVLEMTMYDGRMAIGFLVLLGFNLAFILVAALLVAFEPVAAGSGIPQVKCYLNGVKVPHVARIGTLIAKTVGVLFSVAGGILVGREGPMIHSGAIIGATLPQMKCFLLGKLKFLFQFRSDRDRRDFVSCGSAAGVAAAFGSPLGGVMFSLEEGSSFWNQSLTWKTLFCCFSATFTLNFLHSAVGNPHEIGYLGSPGLVNFGVFNKDEGRLWNVYHLGIFVIMGAIGGLLGALFNSLNKNITKYRLKYLTKRRFIRTWRMLEVFLITMVTTTTVFIVAMSLGTCLPEHIPQTSICSFVTGDQSFMNQTKDFFCPGHNDKDTKKLYYNDMATLMFNSLEHGINQLFHHQNGAFTFPTLLILFIFYFFITCWTNGSAVSGGIFVPSLLIGATYGRFMATVFAYMSNFSPHYFGWLMTLYPGTYALIGAVSFLGGVVRMMISLTVILIETTNQIEYGLPILLTVTVAKFVGDFFNKGINNMLIELRKMPFLEWESPRQLDKLIAKDVMSSENLAYLYPVTRVHSVIHVLKSTCHHGFLVVATSRASMVSLWESMLAKKDKDIAHSKHWPHPLFATADISEYEDSSSSESGSEGTSDLNFKASRGKDLESKDELEFIFRGLILRHQLIALLKNKIFFNESDKPQSQRKIDHATLIQDYPHYPSIYSIDKDISETERNMLMDISQFMNPSPYTISAEAPLAQVFNLFRTMGLRHLPVIKEHGLVAGIITRHDLTHERLHYCHHWKIRQRTTEKMQESI